MQAAGYCKVRSAVILRISTNNCAYKYLSLLYYKPHSLQHVSATYCGHLQGGIRRNKQTHHNHLHLDGIAIYTAY
jgi:hypothetical protein